MIESIIGLANRSNTNHVAAFSLAFWFVLNISTLILNKFIFSTLLFSYPITLTAIHMLICSIGSILVLRVYKLVPLIEINYSEQFSKILLLALLFCSNIVFGNVSLRWVPVSFMQTIKSSVPLFTIVIQILFFKKTFSTKTYLSMIPIVGGVCLASVSEVNFNQAGFLAALIASIITALLAIASGMILDKQMNAVNLLYYMTPPSFIMLLPLAFFTEFQSIKTDWVYYGEAQPALILILSGVIAFLLNIFTFLVIKFTSALTYTVSGNLKVVLSITISVLIFKNEVNFLNGIGCCVAIIGVIWYSQIRYEAGRK
ncbi:hypothetical protein CYY_002799 [Polysphondylium violaceum]|uniref:Sugar phosphate transporter domain-containing protein n=1 Tax=Polysphondylium violaceum TaxID=133409 RepID=A0A8J4PXK8_9MYCE|nr:hypothetical protein CYY_002799 [Polysphondylium violaceum]